MIRPTLFAFVVLTGAAGALHAQGPDGPGRERASFGMFDTNGDGQITQAEVDVLRQARFAELDANGDNQVSRDEFLAHSAARSGERAGRMFDRLDADGDGLLSRDMAEQRIPGREIVARFDTDGDGAVSETEFDEMRERMAARHGGKGRHDGGWVGKRSN